MRKTLHQPLKEWIKKTDEAKGYQYIDKLARKRNHGRLPLLMAVHEVRYNWRVNKDL
jgi:hypothetical protein